MALFAFFMVYVLRIHYRQHHLAATEFGAWVMIWFGFVMLALFPGTMRGIADSLHIGRVFDLLVIIAFMILAVAVFFTRLTVLELRHKFELLIRREAITQAILPEQR